MRIRPYVLLSLLALIFGGLQMTPAQSQQNVPEIKFDSVPDYPTLSPGMNFGEVSGVAVNSKGHVFVFTRSNTANRPAHAPAAGELFRVGADGQGNCDVRRGERPLAPSRAGPEQLGAQ